MKIKKPNEYVNIQKFKICLLLCSLTLLLSNCKKENILLNQNEPKVVDVSKVYKLPTTPSEISLVNNLAKVTDVFKELYKDNSNLRLVNAAIYSKLYKDESILLKDLIFPQESRLVQNKKFNTLTQKWNTSLNSFSKNFWEIVKKDNDKNFELFLNNLSTIRTALLTTGSNDNNESQQVTIYFPYSEVFVLPNDGYVEPLTSIVTATADADEGFGYLPYFDNFGNFQYYIQVLVNDDYAAANPTHIIGVNGIEGETTLFEAPPMPSTSTGMSRVYIGEVICKNQYDKLISFTGNGGGSEIKYCRLSGYLKPVNGQVTTFEDIISADISRYNIRKENWLRLFAVWDASWDIENNEQVLAIYEEDNTNTITFNGSLSTTLGTGSNGSSGGASVTGTIGYSITRQSQDDIIRQLKLSRSSYFSGAFLDQGHGFSSDATFLPLPFTHGWPTYDVGYSSKAGANVGWTWPYQLN